MRKEATKRYVGMPGGVRNECSARARRVNEGSGGCRTSVGAPRTAAANIVEAGLTAARLKSEACSALQHDPSTDGGPQAFGILTQHPGPICVVHTHVTKTITPNTEVVAEAVRRMRRLKLRSVT
jgi:hypothetical protein